MPVTYSLLIALAVYLFEHFVLTRRYGMRSSLQKLRAWTPSSRTDLVAVLFYEFVFRWFSFFASLLCGVGLLYVLVSRLLRDVAWAGVLPGAITENPVLTMVLMFVVVDFVLYATHWAMHAVPVLWRIHRLHHAAEEMTIGNGLRRTVTEVSFQELSGLLLLFFLFGPQRPELILPVLVIRHVFDMIQHSDLPWDYGRMGRLIASPRFHRMHHSNDPRDYNLHFSDILSVWDYLFGTVSARYRQDPTAGSECTLGLGDCPEAERFNRGLGALLHDTFPMQLAALIGRRLPFRRASVTLPEQA